MRRCDLVRMTLFGLSTSCLTSVGEEEDKREEGTHRPKSRKTLGTLKLPHHEPQMSSNAGLLLADSNTIAVISRHGEKFRKSWPRLSESMGDVTPLNNNFQGWNEDPDRRMFNI